MTTLGKALARIKLVCLIILPGILISLLPDAAFGGVGSQPESVVSKQDANLSEGVVYDDSGKPITEEEIRAYMISDYRPGCCLIGGLVGTAASFLLGCAAGLYIYDESDDEESGVITWLGIWGLGTAASSWASYRAGERIDRQKAIELVKEERSTGKKPPQPKRTFLPKALSGLGIAATAAVIISVVIAQVSD